MSDDLRITPTLAIPRTELVFRASRAGGAGGQHVNTSSTRIELLWDFRASSALDDAQRARIAERLATRLDADGQVRVVAANRRSQLQNREEAAARLATLVAGALRERKARKKTAPSRAERQRRLTEKKQRSEKKRQRRNRDFD